MKKSIKYLIGTAALIMLIGCGGGGGTSTGGGSGGGTGTGLSYLKVVNSSSSDSDICNVYSNPSSADTWGPDRLGANVTIPPGYYKTFNTSNCNQNYALKVVFCDGYVDQGEYYRECGTTKELVFRNY